MRPLVRCSTGKAIRWAVIRIHFKINFHSSPSSPQNLPPQLSQAAAPAPLLQDLTDVMQIICTRHMIERQKYGHLILFSDKGYERSYNCNNKMADTLTYEVAENIKPLAF
jgi:hypothetical protein